MQDMTHYQTLGVPPDASQRVLRKAFLALAGDYKRAMISDPSYLGPYERLEAAYEALSDEQSRRRYNAEHALPAPPTDIGRVPVDAVWEQAYLFMMLACMMAAIVIAILVITTGDRPDWVAR